MKKLYLVMMCVGLLVFTGCANNSLNLNSSLSGDTEVVKVFKEGVVVNVQKVLVNDRRLSALTGAGIGAIGGAVTKGKKAKRIVAGAAIGGIIGAMIGKEVEAYQTNINAGTENYVVFLKARLPIDSVVEFVVRENEKISNVNVIGKIKQGVEDEF